IAGGAVRVYEAGGVYQLYVETMIPEGTGDLAAAFQQIKEKLTAEGLFDAAHKKPLPKLPATIGVVTSLSGAVLRDIYRVSKRRFPSVRLVLYPVQVQGETSAAEVAEGIRYFNEKFPVDVMIVGRGGGSAEDLWSFNTEAVVRAIYASKIPVISAVGHETDYTLSDLAADVRAATPSQAAELAVPDARELTARISGLAARLAGARNRWMNAKRMKLLMCLRRRAMATPQRIVDGKRERLARISERFSAGAWQRFREKQQRLDLTMDRLELLNPIRMLRRGYGVVENEEGRVVRLVSETRQGDRLTVILADGRVHADVRAVERGGSK
ncbi:MAG: exodeoxyribonuclease VII large subunit, partial [Schwartzia sp.]|nr:exodeoxyribonuclease VII large subunit [Schwartzia sp. (in: firmicutes)]